jgi:hypothetical protein
VTIRCALAAGPRDDPFRLPLTGRRDDPINTRPGPELAGPGRDGWFIY